MIKTAEQLKEQAKKIKLNFYFVHKCSICGYPCGYTFTPDYEKVGYDAGCDCTYGSGIEERSWESLADCYNMNQPERNPKISKEYLKELNKIWKFK